MKSSPLPRPSAPPPETRNAFFKDVFQEAPVGLMVVRSDTTVSLVNRKMLSYFDMQPADFRGKMFGNIFQCYYAEQEQAVCGDMDRCKNCAIRGGLNAVLRDGTHLDNVALNHDFVLHNGTESKWFYVGGSPLKHEGELFAVMSFVDATREHRQKMLLESQLELDMATGAKNKYSLMEYLSRLIEPQGNPAPVVVCMIDFDHFKEINDRWGHLTGDLVLEHFAHIAHDCLGKDDILGRYGGEEFILIFRDKTIEQAQEIMRGIHIRLKAHFSHTIRQTITFSAGMMTLDGNSHIYTASDLVNRVDQLLYKAKQHGRNCLYTDKGRCRFE